MGGFINLEGNILFSFICRERKKDYGGIYFGLTPDNISLLRKLIRELEREGPGYSRKIGLRVYSPELPDRILPGGKFSSLESLRIGLGETTNISIDGLSGNVVLSVNDITDFLQILNEIEKGAEDIVLAGESGSWDDRLHFWLL